MTFQTLGLSAELLRAVEDQGYTQPTPIQQQAIPVVLRGQDILATAQTGTGKTASFTLPLLQRLSAPVAKKMRRHPRALILTPTRELAAQVADSVTTYGKYLDLKSTVIYGGVRFGPQMQHLQRGVDVLVATPGRLLDHLNQNTLSLAHVEILVLDECDRMLDMGFIHDIRKIMAAVPESRQTLMFSATFPREIQDLASALLNDPAQIDVAPRNSASEQVEQVVHPVDRNRKRELLSYMIGYHNWRQVLVFTRTKHGANRLAEQLTRDGLKSAAIHGNKSQGARTRALADFKRGAVRVLVATDIAARGLDIDQLPHVVNYELPQVPEDYVHRIGRTGRAGNEGRAVSLVSGEEYPLLQGIERLLKRSLAQDVVPGYEPVEPMQHEGDAGKAKSAQRRRSGQNPSRGGRRPSAKAASQPSAKKPAGSRPRKRLHSA
jgi:ATP-dependent RNA helicase RhlE